MSISDTCSKHFFTVTSRMLNLAIFSFGGVVVWSKEPVDEIVINRFVESSVIETQILEKSVVEGKTVRFVTRNDLELVFCAYYPSIVQYRGTEELLSDVATIFVAQFGDSSDEGNVSTVKSTKWLNLEEDDLNKFGALVDIRLKKEGGLVSETGLASQDVESPKSAETESASSYSPSLHAQGVETPESGRASPAIGSDGIHVPGSPGHHKSRRSRKKGTDFPRPDSPNLDRSKTKKKMRKWGDDGMAEDDDSDVVLDYSHEGKGSIASLGNQTEVDMTWGRNIKSGEFVLKELSTELDSILGGEKSKNTSSSQPSSASQPFSFLRSYIGGKKLTPEDLKKAIQTMETHLMKKNVAREVAENICNSVDRSLVGQTTSSWTSVESTVRTAMTEALRRILTPNTSLDLLHEVEANRARAQKSGGRPYVISVVGVNGVGKSTNLSKIGFWLLQNKYKVLIAACDTFRSGAVEQLEVHVRRLHELTQRIGTGHIEIYKQGYGKDAAVIAQKAIEYGEKQGFDVILIDTAGRRHNDDRLMSSLEKFGKLANPNKIIMVGEALVGTDSVQQAHNFNAAFGPSRNVDFFLISKCDTVGDMIGTMVNMTFSTGIPVLFVGIGQNYTDLRTLSVDWAVELLMS